MKWITRRAALRVTALGSVFAAASAYGATHGRSGLVGVKRLTCPLSPEHANLDGLRVAVMSGFHSTLRNQSPILNDSGKDSAVIGLDRAWGGHPNPDEATKGLPNEIPRILSMREPDYFDIYSGMAQPGPILQVSGYTRGGQICAPFIGSLKLPHLAEKLNLWPLRSSRCPSLRKPRLSQASARPVRHRGFSLAQK